VGQRQGSPLTVSDYLNSITPVSGDARVYYGAAPSQWFDLFLPKAAGTAPLVILVHGGCWSDRAGAETVSQNAADLAAHGVAVCSLEYRRVGEAGGGYPGTYLDLSAATDRLGVEASAHGIDLDRIVVVGHSAGGHLALWLAARHRLPAGSSLLGTSALPARSVVVIAGPGDLRHHAGLLDVTCAGMATSAQVVGIPSPERRDPFADTSPADLLPLGIRTISVTGIFDDNWPPHVTARWVDAARAAGDDAGEVILADVGHFEVMDVRSPAWVMVRDCILAEVARFSNAT